MTALAAGAPLLAGGPVGWVAFGVLAVASVGIIYLATEMSEADQDASNTLSNDDASECTGDCGKSRERKNEDGDVILDEDRAEHILNGDKTGGGHKAGTGKPGKTEFPTDWSDDKILDGVADVAQNGTIKGPAHRPGEVVKTGTIDGVDIDVVVKGDGGVRTGYPTGGTGVTKNPR